MISTKENPLSTAQIADYDKDGFLKIPRILTDAEVETLRAEFARVAEGKSERQPVLNRNLLSGGTEYAAQDSPYEVRQIVNIWEASDAFFQLAKHPIITAIVAKLCNTDTLRIWHDQIQYKPPFPKGGPTGWHQDWPLWPSIGPADLLTAWVALDDATIENGCMWMVPGSQKWGDQQKYLASGDNFEPIHREPSRLPAEAINIRAVPVPVETGAVSFHHCLTWHGSPHNKSARPRRAIAIHYMPAHIKFQPRGKHVMDAHIHVKEGEILQGDHFPVVYQAA